MQWSIDTLRVTALALAATAILGTGCSEKDLILMDKSEVAARNGRLDMQWVSPSGDTTQATYDATVRWCKDRIKAASTDQIQQIPQNVVDSCLYDAGWTTRPRR